MIFKGITKLLFCFLKYTHIWLKCTIFSYFSVSKKRKNYFSHVFICFQLLHSFALPVITVNYKKEILITLKKIVNENHRNYIRVQLTQILKNHIL